MKFHIFFRILITFLSHFNSKLMNLNLFSEVNRVYQVRYTLRKEYNIARDILYYIITVLCTTHDYSLTILTNIIYYTYNN